MLSKRVPASTVLIPALALIALVAALGWPSPAVRFIPDAPEYRQFAVGGPVLVHSPYSERVLHPALVHLVSKLSGLSVDSAFLAVAIFMLVAFAMLVAVILFEIGAPPLATVALMFCPLLLSVFHNMYFQDLTQWALIAGFFWLMMHDRVWSAMVMLMLAYITRESAVLLVGAVLLTGLMARDTRLLIGGALAFAIALAVTSASGSLGLPNEHHVGMGLFLLLKIPFEFSRNVLGLRIVPNTLIHTPGNDCAPLFVVTIPRALRAGGLSWVSYCGWDPRMPLGTFITLLTLFGTCPAAILVLAKRGVSLSHVIDHKWLSIALIYGVLAYLLGTSEGTAMNREIGSAWPLFWIALPAMACTYGLPEMPSLLRFAGLSLIATWAPIWIERASAYSNFGLLLTLVVALGLQVVTYRELAKSSVAEQMASDSELRSSASAAR